MSDIADDVRRLYQDVILRRSRTPAHARPPARIDARGTGDNPMCGDRVEVLVQHDPAGRIEQCGFDARGCAISIASADLMAELLPGRTVDEARDIAAAFHHMVETGTHTDPRLTTLHPLAGVHDYPSRRRCATLPWQAMVDALTRAPAQDAAA